MKKKETWLKPRHKVVTALLRYPLGMYCKLRYNIKVESPRAETNRPCVVVFNHQTAFDQFFVSISFKQPIYYLSSEDLYSNGLTSALIRYLVAPIPIKKQTTDITAVKIAMRVAKEGGSIGIAPEGNRTYDGRPVYIKPAIAKLVRATRLPLVIYRIEGGFGVQPRWSDVLRRGKMHSYVARILEPEEIKAMTDEELLEVIVSGLNVCENNVSGTFQHKKLAEYVERVLYYCPKCGLSPFESHGDTVTCKTCGLTAKYLPTKELSGVPYHFLADWYQAQVDYVNALDLSPYMETPAFTDRASLSEVIVCKKKIPVAKDADIALYGDRIEISNEDMHLTLHYDDIGVATVLGKNKLNIYYKDKLYQLKGDARFNALKYMNLYYRYNNLKGDNANEQFLGL